MVWLSLPIAGSFLRATLYHRRRLSQDLGTAARRRHPHLAPGRTRRLKGAYGLLAPCHRGERPGKQQESTITTETAEPIRQGVTKHFGAVAKDIATELQMRHDHGSNSMSNDFQKETTFLGIKASPSLVREPEDNGVAERFIRPLRRTCCGSVTSRPSRNFARWSYDNRLVGRKNPQPFVS